MTLSQRWSTLLDTARQQNRYRMLVSGAGVDFVSNDYLGYNGGRQGQSMPCMEGYSGTSSRLLRGQHPIWEQVEEVLADWHQAEAALVMTSGYVANEGLLSTIIEPGDWVASDQLNHASIVDGLRLHRPQRFIYRHLDLDHLETGLRAVAHSRTPGQELFVVTESLFGMDGDIAPLGELAYLVQRYQAHLIVDEAHATGCFGERGSGLVDALGQRDAILASVHTGGKALGVPGAYVCGSRMLKDLLINRCRHFIYTTALPPAAGEWWLAALQRVAADHEGRSWLHEGAALFRAELARVLGGAELLGEGYIVPLLLGEDTRALQVSHRLRAAGWDIRPIRPPTVPEGTARLRISIHADHSRETLLAAVRAIHEVLT